MQEYCTPNCEVIQSCVVKENPYIPKHVEVKGVDAIYQFWTNMFLTIPDCLIVMLETKLRIKNNRNPTTITTANGETITAVTSAAITRNEGSSIVSSFSFTGTKLYNTDMEGAITKDLDDNAANAQKGNKMNKLLFPGTSKQVQALINKSQKNVKKRSYNADWPNNNPNDPTLSSNNSSSTNLVAAGNVTNPPVTSSSTTIVSANNNNNNTNNSTAVATTANTTAAAATTTTTTATAPAHHTDVSDRYNIFLHPPRRFSTLAGTPFGGSSNAHYYHPPKPNLKNVMKTADYIEITSNTKILTGQYMETEGHINFLGTLTMFLDSENKISRFEFLYSHMD